MSKFSEEIRQLAERAKELKGSCNTEEATKHALVLPFLTALGYDCSDPREVVPEMDCDLTKKRGEKCDYVIIVNGTPEIVVECKHWTENLAVHTTQLARYFTSPGVKFSILTNGLQYWFFTDSARDNVMDETPFLQIDLMKELSMAQLETLAKFRKDNFDRDAIRSSADYLIYLNGIRELFEAEFNEPDDEFVRFFGRRVFKGKQFTKGATEQFRAIVKKAFGQFVENCINTRLENAKKLTGSQYEADEPERMSEQDREQRIVTTEEELFGFGIVRAIVANILPPERITYKDHIDYFNIIVDGRLGKLLCRLRFNNPARLKVSIGKETAIRPIQKVEDLYDFADELRSLAKSFK